MLTGFHLTGLQATLPQIQCRTRLTLSSVKQLIFLAPITLSVFVTLPVASHTIEVAGEVAATFHLEPNHNPKAKQPATVWFALTRRGGQTIPFSQCNCILSVYSLPRSQNAKPLLQPRLSEISIEKFRNIPSATVIFPKSGAYLLELKGTAKNGATFQPFTLTYTVNVGN